MTRGDIPPDPARRGRSAADRRYTLRTWGEAQAIKYIDELESACHRLAMYPGLGRPCPDIRPGLNRSEVGKHVVFYRRVADGILVVRVLHQRMLPGRHSFDEENQGVD